MARMGRPREEETKIQSFRLPVRILRMIKKLADNRDRSLNAQVWTMLEDWFIERGHMKKEQRRRKE